MRMPLDIHKAICQIREDKFCLVINFIRIQVNARMEFFFFFLNTFLLQTLPSIIWVLGKTISFGTHIFIKLVTLVIFFLKAHIRDF